jgi:hypothetical protein
MNTTTNGRDCLDNLELNDFDKWAVEQRVKESNRKWLFDRVVKIIIGAAIGLFIAKAMRGG